MKVLLIDVSGLILIAHPIRQPHHLPIAPQTVAPPLKLPRIANPVPQLQTVVCNISPSDVHPVPRVVESSAVMPSVDLRLPSPATVVGPNLPVKHGPSRRHQIPLETVLPHPEMGARHLGPELSQLPPPRLEAVAIRLRDRELPHPHPLATVPLPLRSLRAARERKPKSFGPREKMIRRMIHPATRMTTPPVIRRSTSPQRRLHPVTNPRTRALEGAK